jgi:hypothetical protein
LAKSLLDLLREKNQFVGEGEPTTDYLGLGTDQVTEAVDGSLDVNDNNPSNPNLNTYGRDEEAQSVIDNIKKAARRDPELQEILDGVRTMDDILFKELTEPYLGSAYLQGFQRTRYFPEGLGRQYPNNSGLADLETVQIQNENGVQFETLADAGNRELIEQTKNPPGGSGQSRFTSGILSPNSNEGVNEIQDFYTARGQRPPIGTQRNNDLNATREALANGDNISEAMDEPQNDSALRKILKNNRFQPRFTAFPDAGFDPERYYGPGEYSPTGEVPRPYSANDLPFEQGELTSLYQEGRNYRRLPSATNQQPGGIAAVSDERIDQINENTKNPSPIGTQRRSVEEIIEAIETGEKISVEISKSPNFGVKLAYSPDEIRNLRYFNLEPDVDPLYFNDLEYETGQFVNRNVPGLREISVSHLVYELSKFRRGGPIPVQEPPLDGVDNLRNRGVLGQVAAGAIDGVRQVGNSLLTQAQSELERVSGRGREIARALLAPRGSSLREVLRTTEPTATLGLSLLGRIGRNDSTGAQTQNSRDAIRARLRDTDNSMRRLFDSDGNERIFSTLKERYKEGFEIAGNFGRSFNEYRNDFIGLAEDIQTIRDFFLKNGVERFYLSRNQVLISPFNNAKGRGMEFFGTPQDKIDRQQRYLAPNYVGDILGIDGERTINRIRETANPIVQEVRRRQGSEQAQLILGVGQDPNLLGTSRTLDFMHGGLRGNENRVSRNLFRAFLRTEQNGSSEDTILNMVTLLSRQLGRSSNLATNTLPQTTLINSYELEKNFNLSGDVDIDSNNDSPGSGAPSSDGKKPRRRFGSRIANSGVGRFAQDAAQRINNARSGIFSQKVAEALQKGNVQTYNDPDHLEQFGTFFRVKPSVVRRVEEALESQFIPFYFQDLRTNEIISFHAFLEDLRDNFNPEYNVNKYIGRVDPVITYAGNTERSITVTFYVVATSPNDFQYMYEKVNRFIGFVYPQFNEGEKYRADIGAGNNLKFKFADGTSGKAVIPFSQKQKAGPVVRMRVGDIIKSRAFDDNDTEQPRITGRTERFFGIRDVTDITDSAYSDKAWESFSGPDTEVSVLNRIRESVDSQAGNQIQDLNNEIRQNLADEGFVTVGNVPVDQLTFVNDEGEIVVPEQFANENVTSVGLNQDGEPSLLSGNDRELHSQYLASLTRIDQIVNETVSNSNATIRASILEYNSYVSTINAINRGNALIRRSFTNIGGRGLPGVVSNLQFALIDEFPWEIEPGLRAPQGFKISFTFQVMHDLPPGLDSRGEMRPVYAPKIQDGPIGRRLNPLAPMGPYSGVEGESKLPATTPPPRLSPRTTYVSGDRTVMGIILNAVESSRSGGNFFNLRCQVKVPQGSRPRRVTIAISQLEEGDYPIANIFKTGSSNSNGEPEDIYRFDVFNVPERLYNLRFGGQENAANGGGDSLRNTQFPDSSNQSQLASQPVLVEIDGVS